MTIAARPAPGASWREWVATALELAGKARCERFFGRLAYLPLTGDGLWQVRQGVVQLTVTQASGDEVLVGLAGPGMPVGLPLTGLPTHQAQALTDVYAVWLTLADLERSGTLAQALLFPLMRRLRQTEHLLVITAGQRRVQERLRHLLLLLMQEVGQPVEQGVRLEVRLTHQSLAN
ncbi:MAG: Crp/Fnr family transcriptional regulator, partial [Gloeomargarita sp. GMQP_bins_69]